MSYKKRFVILAVALSISAFILLGSSALNPAECAESYDVTVCVSVDVTPLVQSQEITIFTYDGKGIMRSNNGGQVFDNCTVHLQGIALFEGKNRTMHSYLKYLDPDGDFVIFRKMSKPGEKTVSTTIMMGTGKWKGITGSGIATQITKGKPVATHTNQLCTRHKGTFTLPK
jgi:hypothetical protein